MIADNDFLLDNFNPVSIMKGIAVRMRARRLELNLTQKGLATKAGVSMGSLKRFENSHEISLKHLIMIAVVLDATEEFEHLFSKRQYESIEEVLKMSKVKKRERGSQNA
ncbi:MAG: helix-turn-helix transcriptional regulator [Bacteroidetes bacterium]|nr:helix-turn-helix transcriptional regulator [Bacteroidota bacterium]